jgi:methionine-rich copper-binding protein CopC
MIAAKKAACLAVLLVGLALVAPTSASANTLVSSTPPSGSVLTETPNTVTLVSQSPLLDQGNEVSVTDSMGNRVDDGSLTISDVNAIVGMKPLTSTGVYTVSYTLLALNDDPLTGTFTFTFNAPAVITSASPTPSVVSPSATAVSGGATDNLVIGSLVISFFIFIFLVWYAYRLFSISQTKKRKRK